MKLKKLIWGDFWISKLKIMGNVSLDFNKKEAKQ